VRTTVDGKVSRHEGVSEVKIPLADMCRCLVMIHLDPVASRLFRDILEESLQESQLHDTWCSVCLQICC
jgi:hypothetical protein